jgi:hypothetical protein
MVQMQKGQAITSTKKRAYLKSNNFAIIQDNIDAVEKIKKRSSLEEFR